METTLLICAFVLLALTEMVSISINLVIHRRNTLNYDKLIAHHKEQALRARKEAEDYLLLLRTQGKVNIYKIKDEVFAIEKIESKK